MPEPALRLAWYLKDLHGAMLGRFGQFQMARHYRAVEARAKAAFRTLDAPAATMEATGRTGAVGHTPRVIETPARKAERFFGWFERQLDRLATASPSLQPGQAPAGHARPEPISTPDMER